MTTIAVVGPGAIGGTVAAWLARSHEVVVVARTPFERLEVETPSGVLSSQPTLVTDPAQATPVDWVLFATKTYDVEAAATWLPPLRRSDTPVAVLQNGVEHVERFAPYLSREQILPVILNLPAERRAPGKIRQKAPGRLFVPKGPLGRRFVDLFRATELDASEHDDWTTRAWEKLCLNSSGAVSAVLGAPTAIARHDGVAEILASVVRECIAVGRAEGAKLDDALVREVIEAQRRSAPDSVQDRGLRPSGPSNSLRSFEREQFLLTLSVNSLTADRIAGRPMEIDARNGVIVRLGRRHGIATPMNAMLVALLEAATTYRQPKP
jgi:2-dehydropantoate 2-reductase